MDYKEQLEKYLKGTNKTIGDHNATLIKQFNEKHSALPTDPTYERQLVVTHRLVSISKMINNHALDKLTETELIKLNKKMKDKNMTSAPDYRKSLKQFLKLTNKKKYIDLIDSDYLKNIKDKNGTRTVDPDSFWTEQQIQDYIIASKNHSNRQLAWATLWLSTGGNPREILNIKKEDIIQHEDFLKIRIKGTKTAYRDRTIILEPKEAKQVLEYLQPRLKEIQTGEQIIDIDWRWQDMIHKKICDKINLPQNKSRILYIGRKMALTRFYTKYKLTKASAMAGHTYGSKDMKHYIALTEDQLMNTKMTGIERKTCPNPSCGKENPTHLSNCQYCQSPLDREKFSGLFTKQILDIIKAETNLAIKEINKTK